MYTKTKILNINGLDLDHCEVVTQLTWNNGRLWINYHCKLCVFVAHVVFKAVSCADEDHQYVINVNKQRESFGDCQIFCQNFFELFELSRLM